MSKARFFKHLSSSFLYRATFIHHPLLCSSPLSICKPKSGFQWKPTSLTSSSPFRCSTSLDTLTTATATATTTESSAYLSVRIFCPRHVADMLSEALLCFGASSTSIDQEDECETSNEICIDSIFPEGQDVDACLSQAVDSIGLKKIPNYEVKTGEQCDWIQQTVESFYPVEVTEGFWIVPEWRSPPDIQATNIILNPGLAFGTGEHPTTKLCLLLLQGLIKGGELFLDYGTGSGILAIAALKFGAALSVGFDVDPQAITSARHNAALNSIRPETMQLHLVPGKTSSPVKDEKKDKVMKKQSSEGTRIIFETEKYDVVIANILLNPLLELSDHIVSYAKPGAIVGVSGILSEQCSDIENRYSVLLEDLSVSEMDGWACVSGRKRSNHNSS